MIDLADRTPAVTSNVVPISATQTEAQLVAGHAGHALTVVVYPGVDGEQRIVAVECEDCMTTIQDLDFESDFQQAS